MDPFDITKHLFAKTEKEYLEVVEALNKLQIYIIKCNKWGTYWYFRLTTDEFLTEFKDSPWHIIRTSCIPDVEERPDLTLVRFKEYDGVGKSRLVRVKTPSTNPVGIFPMLPQLFGNNVEKLYNLFSDSSTSPFVKTSWGSIGTMPTGFLAGVFIFSKGGPTRISFYYLNDLHFKKVASIDAIDVWKMYNLRSLRKFNKISVPCCNKTIMVGSDYQAVIPDGNFNYDTPPYENEDKLLWDPAKASDDDLSNYMVRIKKTNESRDRIPQGSHLRDDEQALYLLLQCGYDYEESIRRHKSAHFSTPAVSTMSVWSEDECRNFESGLRIYGKDFYLIQQHKVRTRSVGELVQFYYLWKKTERHDVFANKSKLEKKKYTLHPGTTYLEYRDFMEKFLDEQDSGPSSSHVHSLLSSDSKRRASPLPMLQQGNDSDSLITPDEVRILQSHVEDLARHLSPHELESLVQLTAATRVPNGLINQGSGNDTVSAMSISQPEAKMHSFAQ